MAKDELASLPDRPYLAFMTLPLDEPGPAVTRPIRIGRFNTAGFLTLYQRETKRFLKILGQTVAAPMMTAVLFMAVFAVAIGDRLDSEAGVNYIVFIGPGLVMMAALQNAFANTSTALVVSKVQGNVVDYLTPPLGPLEVILAMTGGGITRGVVVGVSAAFALALLGSAGWPVNPFLALVFLVLGSAVMALAGILTGIWAEKFDGLSAVTSFVVQPMVFLSGTFYTIERLPAPIDSIAAFNPVFHMIDGYRYGTIGVASFPPLYGIAVLVVLTLILGVVCWWVLRQGYKLKA